MFRQATEADLPAILSIIRQAQAYLASQGVDQWQDGTPNAHMMRGDLRDGVSYVLEWDGEVIGMATVIFTGEPTYAVIEGGAWATPEPYGCIHRFALSAAHRGTGVSGKLMAGAEQIIRGRGVSSARIDTHRDNLVMQGMLKKNGYTPRGMIYLANGDPRVAFEKALT